MKIMVDKLKISIRVSLPTSSGKPGQLAAWRRLCARLLRQSKDEIEGGGND